MYIVFSRVLLPPLSIHRLVSPFLDSGPDGVDDLCFYTYEEFFHVGHELALFLIFSRVLCDFIPRFVGPSVHPSVRTSVRLSVRPSVALYFFGVYGVFGYTAPAQMLH